jgi:hypothetical protein
MSRTRYEERRFKFVFTCFNEAAVPLGRGGMCVWVWVRERDRDFLSRE